MWNLLTHFHHRNFQRLWLAQLISQFGDRIHQLALIGLIAERAPGSTWGLAKVMACTIIPVFIVQPFAGVLIDRWDRRTTLFVCDIFRSLLVVSIPFVFIYGDSMIPIYGVVFFVFCFSRFYVPAKMSIIPDLVHRDYLFQANSLMTTTGMMATGLGAAFGAFLIEYFGARNGFIIDAATFLISSVFLFQMTLPWRGKLNTSRLIETGKEIVGPIRKSIWAEMMEGVGYLIQHKEIRFVMNIFFVLFGVAGSLYVVLIVFIQEVFDSVTRDLGILAICFVAGLLLGTVAYGRWGKKVDWTRTVFLCLTAGGIMLMVFAVCVAQKPSLWLAMILAGVWGLTIGPIIVATNTTVHLLSDESMRGKVFSALEIVMHLAFLITMFLSAWLSSFMDEMWILIGVGVICAGIGVLGMFSEAKFQSNKVAKISQKCCFFTPLLLCTFAS